MKELLILVDEQDNEIGVMDKLSAHKKGVLHRAFSLFIFNTKGELLLQQRADIKYHSAGLWSNTCCSHPNAGEKISASIARRLMEEMGITCDAEFKFSFIYKAQLDNGLTEHELDHVYFGYTDDKPNPDSEEVKDWRFISLQNLVTEMAMHPEMFSAWLKICLPDVIRHYEKNFNK
ncbi:MAG: isopentenyl-diphosphate Delta-isomerase [Chitinophagaceae bacterium]|nr:isopentenyl-diphosphate Delta-isomerase [Chitinophagaceae bacterium]